MRNWPAHCGYADSVCSKLTLKAPVSQLLPFPRESKYHIAPEGVKRATEASTIDSGALVGVACTFVGYTLISSNTSMVGRGIFTAINLKCTR